MRMRLLAILAIAAIAVGAFALTRPVAPQSPASAGSPTTPDGYSRFTPVGHEWFTTHGEIVVRIDHVATELALPAYGASRFALVPPLEVKVVKNNDESSVVPDVAQILMFTHLDRLVTVKLTTSTGEVLSSDRRPTRARHSAFSALSTVHRRQWTICTPGYNIEGMGRILAWLSGGLLVLGTTITGLNLINPEPIDPGSPLATQTEDGMSRFSQAGEAFIEQRGELFVRVGGESGSATELALPPRVVTAWRSTPPATCTCCCPTARW